MKLIGNIAKKVIDKVQENPKLAMKFGAFIVIALLFVSYPITASIIGAFACIVAIDNKEKVKDSLDMFKVPTELAKDVASETKKAIDDKKAEMEAKKNASASAKAEASAPVTKEEDKK